MAKLYNNLQVSLAAASPGLSLPPAVCCLCTISWHQPRAGGDVTAWCYEVSKCWYVAATLRSRSLPSEMMTAPHWHTDTLTHRHTMDHCWHLHTSVTHTDHHSHRPLLGRLLLVPNQEIIQEQYETSNSSRWDFKGILWNEFLWILCSIKTEDISDSIDKSMYLQTFTSFTENRLDVDYFLTPENR